CRKCGESGDTIAYLMKVDGLDFKGALSELGIEGTVPSHHRRKAPAEPRRDTQSWTPKTGTAATDTWSAYALKLVEEGEQHLPSEQQAMAWLAARGIDAVAAARYRLGYLLAESGKLPGRFRARAALGLEPKTGDDGKVRSKIFIPRGILIPTFSGSGSITNLRIRRHKADLQEHRSPKYMELEGSAKVPFLLRSSQPKHLAVYFVVEAELDAILIHHASGGVVGALAVRTNRGKPDAASHALLEQAVRICVALDYDQAGAEGCDFWKQTYAQAVRWPTPEGKDPGDAYRLGVDIREWIAAALPPCVELPSGGQSDRLQSGEVILGGGGEPKEGTLERRKWPSERRARLHELAMSPRYNLVPQAWGTEQPEPFPYACEEDFTPEELDSLNCALPRETPLDAIYLDVAVIWLLWRGLPVTLAKNVDATGAATGFDWEYSQTWWNNNQEAVERFFRHQYVSRAFWEWVSEHPAKRITWKNLLRFYELFKKQKRR
ncbi:MAG: hypothetical protein K2G99_08110, partial [Desulfovibrio sp.]|nr:hypothetical protein [Desulfovibrio sp.]